MNPTERVKILLGDLPRDVARYQQLEALLQQQRASMLACNAAQCESTGAEIMAVYHDLTASSRRRRQILLSFHLSADGEGMQKLFSRLPAAIHASATRHWQQLITLASGCRQCNDRNGLLLNAQQETLAALLQDRPHHYLYSPQGPA